MGERQRIDEVGQSRPRVRNRRLTKWPLQTREACVDARSRDVWDEQLRGLKCRYIFCIGISGRM